MNTISAITAFAIALIGMFGHPPASWAQSNPDYVRLSGRIPGALYKPDSGPAPHIVIIIANGGSNIVGTPQCMELVRRGFMLFCQNTVLDGDQARSNWDDSPLDFKDTIPSHTHIDPALDPFSAAHGFSANSPTHYPKGFVARYAVAQARRENALIDQAEAMIAARRNGQAGRYIDDLMILPGNGNAWTNGAPLSPTDYDITKTTVSGGRKS